MRRRRIVELGVAVAAVAGVVAVGVAADGGDPGDGLPGRQRVELASALVQPGSCPAVLEQLREQAIEQVTPYGIQQQGLDMATSGAAEMATSAPASRSAAPQVAKDDSSGGGADFSGTNLQEKDVDEPDLVKNDGERAFTLTGRTLRALRIVDDGAVREAGSLDLDISDGAELLLVEDDVVVLSPNGDFGTELHVVDARVHHDLRVVHTAEVEGRYLSARRIGDAIRLVVTQGGPAFDFIYPTTDSPFAREGALRHNRAAIREAELAEWLPDITVDDGPRQVPAAPCDHLYVPPSFSGPGSTSVVTFSADDGKVLDATSVMVSASEVYATTEHLYVAAPSWVEDAREMRTEIHRFDISDPTRAQYEATGSVAGNLIQPPWFAQGPVGQWSLSEHDGDLRVATTRWNTRGESDSVVTVLRRDGQALTAVGSINGIGKGEQLYAVRFMGAVGYVVTYKKVDPLYVLDLADPRSPRVTGELKVPGYSAYLHPIGEGRLLGIGQDDPNEDGIADGTQVSLFDVSDPARPRRLDNVVLGSRGTVSGVESDPRTFTWWADPARAILTLSNFQEPNAFEGAVALDPSGDRLREVGRLGGGGGNVASSTCGTPNAMRTRVIGDAMLLFSSTGVRTAALRDLSARHELTFRAGAEQPAADPPAPGSSSDSGATSSIAPAPRCWGGARTIID
jgi:uncharacterized secreted protein with C-terminal beta-propeller domain